MGLAGGWLAIVFCRRSVALMPCSVCPKCTQEYVLAIDCVLSQWNRYLLPPPPTAPPDWARGPAIKVQDVALNPKGALMHPPPAPPCSPQAELTISKLAGRIDGCRHWPHLVSPVHLVPPQLGLPLSTSSNPPSFSSLLPPSPSPNSPQLLAFIRVETDSSLFCIS